MDCSNQLPADVLVKIFKHLGFEDIKRCFPVCKSFYSTLKEVTGSVPCVSLSNLDVGNKTLCILNAATNSSIKSIPQLNVSGDDTNAMLWILMNYSVLRLNVTNLPYITSLLSTHIAVNGSLDSLRELTFALNQSLNLNIVQFLPEICPNLQALAITNCDELEDQYFLGGSFTNLTTFTIAFDGIFAAEKRSDIYSTDDILTTIFSKTPRLERLTLSGHVFAGDLYPSTSFLLGLPKLTFFAVNVSNTTYFLPQVWGVPELKSLDLKRDNPVYSQPVTILPTACLSRLENFQYSGPGLAFAMEHYIIGENLTELSINNGDRAEITRACSMCPKLELLSIPNVGGTVTWLVALSIDHTPKLKKVELLFLDADQPFKRLLTTEIETLYLYHCPRELDQLLEIKIDIFYSKHQ